MAERKDTLEFALWAYEFFSLAHVLGDGTVTAIIDDKGVLATVHDKRVLDVKEGGVSDGKE